MYCSALTSAGALRGQQPWVGGSWMYEDAQEEVSNRCGVKHERLFKQRVNGIQSTDPPPACFAEKEKRNMRTGIHDGKEKQAMIFWVFGNAMEHRKTNKRTVRDNLAED